MDLSSSVAMLIIVEIIAHTIRIFIVKSSKFSKTNSQKVAGGLDSTLLLPKHFSLNSIEPELIPLFLLV
jgi:hypothetical protein